MIINGEMYYTKLPICTGLRNLSSFFFERFCQRRKDCYLWYIVYRLLVYTREWTGRNVHILFYLSLSGSVKTSCEMFKNSAIIFDKPFCYEGISTNLFVMKESRQTFLLWRNLDKPFCYEGISTNLFVMKESRQTFLFEGIRQTCYEGISTNLFVMKESRQTFLLWRNLDKPFSNLFGRRFTFSPSIPCQWYKFRNISNQKNRATIYKNVAQVLAIYFLKRYKC